MLSTFNDYSADELVVKLDNFGFATQIPLPGGSLQRSFEGKMRLGDKIEKGDQNTENKRPFTEAAPKDDILAVGYIILETTLLALTENSDATMRDLIDRLALEIFREDFPGLK